MQAYSLKSTYNTISNYAKTSHSPKSSKRVVNEIDCCWRSNPNWASRRQALADCVIGFGSGTLGGKFGAIYVVTNPSDNPTDPQPGTLRYGVIQTKPLWIVFAKDMVIKLKNELIMNSYKTIDGRGAKVEIAYGPCITIQGVSHIIIHGISIHDCKPGKSGLVRSTPAHVGHRGGSDGDAVVMLFGHDDSFTDDKVMKVTVVFNHFGHGLVQRMPRVRLGYAHIANNMYEEWQMYAIGGSGNPTIFSEGNYFIAPNNADSKAVTKREVKSGWKNWKWRSSKDQFVNGAYFVQSGYGNCAPNYSKSQVFSVAPGSMVPALTSAAGPLQCVPRKPC
ncbi:hypothetical protein Sjap_025205 [Stephania japonica]|uniref:Pectate lyase n=1 Tax=Stephania japonica TaxID=461633 RepID=A0AAP0HFD6_9MAGN